MDERMDGPTNRRTDRPMNRRTDRLMDGQTDRPTHDQSTDGLTKQGVSLKTLATKKNEGDHEMTLRIFIFCKFGVAVKV